MSNTIEPDWSAYDRCRRCSAAAGGPCRDMRVTASAMPPWARRKMRNPHAGRRRLQKGKS